MMSRCWLAYGVSPLPQQCRAKAITVGLLDYENQADKEEQFGMFVCLFVCLLMCNAAV